MYLQRVSAVLFAAVSLFVATAAAQDTAFCGSVNGTQLAGLLTAILQGAQQQVTLNNCSFSVGTNASGAALAPPPASAATPAPAQIVPLNPIAKRGIGTWNPSHDLPILKGADWWYSWGIDPGADAIAAGESHGFEFVSMVVRCCCSEVKSSTTGPRDLQIYLPCTGPDKVQQSIKYGAVTERCYTCSGARTVRAASARPTQAWRSWGTYRPAQRSCSASMSPTMCAPPVITYDGSCA